MYLLEETYDLSNSISLFGKLEVTYYAICILSGVLVAYFIGVNLAKKMGIKKDDILDGVIYCLPLAIIGARLYYVIFEWESYKDNFIDIFKIWEGGLAIHGGIITAIIFICIYCKVKHLDIWKIFDVVFPVFLLSQALGRFGNYYNCEAHGDIMSQGVLNFLHFVFPDALIDRYYWFYGSYYHPTYLYEACWNVLGFILIWNIRKLKFAKKGDSLGFYMIWYGIGRFFIEFMRTDSLYVNLFGHELKQNVIISGVLVVLGIAYILIKRFVLKINTPFRDTYVEDYEKTPALKDMIEE